LHELGIAEEFLKLPHQKVAEIRAQIGDTLLPVADFSRLPVRSPFIAMLPQWDFLDFIARQAARYAKFELRMQIEVTGLLFDGDKVVGVKATAPEGEREIRADLVVGADGRHSLVRSAAGLEVRDLGAPIDVLWFRLSKQPGDPEATMGRFDRGRILVMLNRDDYWQCAFVIGKGSLDAVRAQGLDAFRERLGASLPFTRERVREIASWDDLKLLTVQVNRLRRWYREGLLCIGDAAHAMSPVGGVGINLAIQDAVAAANILCAGGFAIEPLRAVQARREFPTRVTQAFQVAVQNLILQRLLAQADGAGDAFKPPLAARMLGRFSLLRRIPARMIGMGVRPEHIRSPEVMA
jgi:2-polyprenyl-6-methoxyphenol hydroxylase-like FAD-dependent oxidoreductase